MKTNHLALNVTSIVSGALLSAALLISPAPAQTAPPSGQTASPSADPTTRPIIPSGKDQLDNMLKPSVGADRVLQPLQDPPKINQATGASAVAPAAPALNLIREGSYIVDRTGRLTKSADGQQSEFTFDADARAMKDPPMIILPNLKLMAMENAVTGSSRDVRFKITGQITEYKGRNYVLLEKVVVQPD